ncbi:hypothetical protein [Kitasatospora sp. MMS16-BH015]|uniref:hypothetical protein n=1 Tax=Kitasatospora sp. MMS16-BH015 TaxID=2018025 RepID=UPI000CF26B10|nr:hypothetical protein [Kitasatospora sp. MMS16-BH015]
MSSTAITALHRGRAVDPGQVLTGPLRGVGLSWLEPGESILLEADEVEHAVYVTAGSGLAAAEGDGEGPDEEVEVPLAEGTALTLPLGGEVTIVAGEAGLEYFHAVLAVSRGGIR